MNIFVYLGAMNHTRQSMIRMCFMVGDLGHKVSAWPLEGLNTKVPHTCGHPMPTSNKNSGHQGSHELPWFHVRGHTSLLGKQSIWPHGERTSGNLCLTSPGLCPLCLGRGRAWVAATRMGLYVKSYLCLASSLCRSSPLPCYVLLEELPFLNHLHASSFNVSGIINARQLLPEVLLGSSFRMGSLKVDHLPAKWQESHHWG